MNPRLNRKEEPLARFTIREVYCYTEWISATYRDKEGTYYEIIYNNTFNSKKLERKELISVEHASRAISTSDAIWKEITEYLNGLDPCALQNAA